MSSIPAFVAAGTAVHGTGSISPGVPAGCVAGDLLVIFVESENQDISMTTGGWTQVDSAQGSGTAANDAAVRLEIFWKIHSGSESAPTVADSGDHTSARMYAWRGVDTTTPIHVAAGDAVTTTTSVSFPGVTTSIANCLIVHGIAGSQDTTSAQLGACTNAALSNITERGDDYTTDAGGGGISVVEGGKATAGATGNTTATLSNTSAQARTTFAIAPQIAFSVSAAGGSFALTGQTNKLRLNGVAQDEIVETFENAPLTGSGTLTWTKIGSGTVASSTSKVTEGTKSWKFSGTSTTVVTSNVIDLRPYTGVKVDIGVVTAGDAGAYFTVLDSADLTVGFIVASDSIDKTITVGQILASEPTFDLSAVRIRVGALASISFEVYFDKLRLVWPVPYIVASSGVFNLGGSPVAFLPIPPAVDQVLETFDNPPLFGDLNWSSLYGGTVTLGAAHVTQGSGSWNVAVTTAENAFGITALLPDLTGYEELTLDTYINAVAPDDGIAVYLSNGIDTDQYFFGTMGATGAETIVCDLTLFTDLTALTIIIYGLSIVGDTINLLTGDMDFDLDNLFAPGTAAAAFSLSADGGSFLLTGSAAGVYKGSLVSAGAGTFNLSGTDVSFAHSIALAVASGSFVLTGSDTDLKKSSLISADAGAFVLTGTAVSLKAAFLLSAGSGTFDITGSAVNLAAGLRIAANGGSYVLTGDDINLLATLILSAASGSYLWTGSDVSLTFASANAIAADAGAFLWTGSAVDLLNKALVSAASGSYVWTGSDANTLLSAVLAAASGVYDLTGYDADLHFTASEVQAIDYIIPYRRRRR